MYGKFKFIKINIIIFYNGKLSIRKLVENNNNNNKCSYNK